MDIHNLTTEEKKQTRNQHMRMDFPYAYSISLGEYKCNRTCRMCPIYTVPPKKNRYMADDVFEKACLEVDDRDNVSLKIQHEIVIKCPLIHGTTREITEIQWLFIFSF